MIGTFADCHHDIMLCDTEQFVIHHLRQVTGFGFKASKENRFSVSVPDEVPVRSELQPRGFGELI
ncbi:hypothetical protein J2741_001321 [Methanolinea mesophila]|uniref:hypothetical protein n=1 Tax=Methanolinea mesophila TaxID=547055 RepID=UPI001AE393B0|nr:hypothetical protein [Methanolinea mesophila]MBP1928774.1 hypothetical protein [Methanolinea mesophila]